MSIDWAGPGIALMNAGGTWKSLMGAPTWNDVVFIGTAITLPSGAT